LDKNIRPATNSIRPTDNYNLPQNQLTLDEVNGLNQRPPEKEHQKLAKLKETFISKQAKPRSFMKKLFKSRRGEKPQNQTSSEGSLDIVEPFLKTESVTPNSTKKLFYQARPSNGLQDLPRRNQNNLAENKPLMERNFSTCR
jgi:hypothetical protein